MENIKNNALAALILSSCSHKEKTSSEKENTSSEITVEPQTYINTVDIINPKVDSILKADNIIQPDDALGHAIQDSINNLSFWKTPNDAIVAEFDIASKKIAGKFVESLKNDLNKFKLNPNIEKLYYIFDKQFVNGFHYNYLDLSYINSNYSPEEAPHFDSKKVQQDIVRNVMCVAGAFDLSETFQKQVETVVEKNLQILILELTNARKSIEKKYAPYVSGGLTGIREAVGLNETEGIYWYCYATTTDTIYKYRYINLYDQDLQIPFFGDPDAEYKVENVGPNKWRITKKTKDGKISKTKVFSDTKEYHMCKDTCKKVPFTFERGTNTGVFVKYYEFLGIETPQKIYVPDPKKQAKYDRLNEALTKYEVQKEKYKNSVDSVRNVVKSSLER